MLAPWSPLPVPFARPAGGRAHPARSTRRAVGAASVGATLALAGGMAVTARHNPTTTAAATSASATTPATAASSSATDSESDDTTSSAKFLGVRIDQRAGAIGRRILASSDIDQCQLNGPFRQWARMLTSSSSAGMPHWLRTRSDASPSSRTRWSRFIPSSEVSDLNEHAGRPRRVSPRHASSCNAHSRRGARPAVCSIPQCSARSSAPATTERSTSSPRPPHGGASDLMTGCAASRSRDTVRLPFGTGFDPGGIGKGLAADMVAQELRDMGADGVCINLGGDVRVAGGAPDGGAWTIAVHHPTTSEPIAAWASPMARSRLRRRCAAGGKSPAARATT